jgi:hypothetical protein
MPSDLIRGWPPVRVAIKFTQISLENASKQKNPVNLYLNLSDRRGDQDRVPCWCRARSGKVLHADHQAG